MGYFITGGTGFIGRRLVARLTARGEPVYLLVRRASSAALERLLASCGKARELVVPIEGDLTAPELGVDVRYRAEIRGRVLHFFHLAALYDLDASAKDLERINVQGTRNAIDFAHAIDAGRLHFVSSIAVAGRFPGRFTEQMFEEATGLDHPYFRTKHESEALVRKNGRIPWRIYRPGMVVGDSTNGEMDKIDGPYYLFKPIQKLRDGLPRWLPLPGFTGGFINLVPVDFVASALDHLAHVPDQDGRCFHLTAREDRRLGEVLNIFARAAHAPTMSLRQAAWVTHIARTWPQLRDSFGPLRRVMDQMLVDLNIPRSSLSLLEYPTTFDSSEAQRLLTEANIRVPRLEDYAWRLWDYWERQLDPDSAGAQRLRRCVEGKTILITGASSGIGRATAIKLADAGALVVIVARDTERLSAVRCEIESRQGKVATYLCDISDGAACGRLLSQLLADHPRIDVLINNAGRSIRRAIEHSYDRLHDHERLMRINYHAAVQMTLGLLPSMVKRGSGHIINISSIGVLGNAPRFSAYNASKSALEAFSRCAAAEFKHRGVHFTVVNMPLVRTPMTAPTEVFGQFKLLEPEQAADIVCDAVIRRPERLSTALGTLSQVIELLAPALSRAIMSETFELLPESRAALGEHANDASSVSAETVFGSTSSPVAKALVELLSGVE